ncbi:translation initiation factor IF-2-like [Trachypithecus francoisi]|uniref:translation initiation factor IF-2-like n=1 Tax=Trachypithecus francoisi TaxID=54180 RepID=UPI00141BB90D|nr:translation initiation factor IF-2-like [Trachypithecus francoisi]
MAGRPGDLRPEGPAAAPPHSRHAGPACPWPTGEPAVGARAPSGLRFCLPLARGSLGSSLSGNAGGAASGAPSAPRYLRVAGESPPVPALRPTGWKRGCVRAAAPRARGLPTPRPRCPLPGRGADPLRGAGAERRRRGGIAPRLPRSLRPRIRRPPRRRPEARGKVNGFGGGEEPARGGGGGASVQSSSSPARLRARGSPPSAPPSASRPRPHPHLPGSLGLGFPGAPPWTSGSRPRDAVLPLRSRP